MPLYIKFCIVLAIVIVAFIIFSDKIDKATNGKGKVKRIILISGIGAVVIIFIAVTLYIAQGLSI